MNKVTFIRALSLTETKRRRHTRRWRTGRRRRWRGWAQVVANKPVWRVALSLRMTHWLANNQQRLRIRKPASRPDGQHLWLQLSQPLFAAALFFPAVWQLGFWWQCWPWTCLLLLPLAKFRASLLGALRTATTALLPFARNFLGAFLAAASMFLRPSFEHLS